MKVSHTLVVDCRYIGWKVKYYGIFAISLQADLLVAFII
jgi:hypothetical protein